MLENNWVDNREMYSMLALSMKIIAKFYHIFLFFNIGWLYDQLGDYQSGFYFSGAMIFLSGVMLFALPRMQQKQRDKEIYEEEDQRFPQIVEEEVGYDSDDNQQMTMEARA